MLHGAASNGQNHVISYLLGIGADPNIQNEVSIYIYIIIYSSKCNYIINT